MTAVKLAGRWRGNVRSSVLALIVGGGLMIVLALGFARLIYDPNEPTSPKDDREFPWAVYLKGDEECAGVIVGGHWILTAAHCVDESSINDKYVYVYVGKKQYEPEEDGIKVPAGDIHLHPPYKANSDERNLQEYDVALIKLEQSLDLTQPNMKAITLGKQADESGNAFVAVWTCSSSFRRTMLKLKLVRSCGDAVRLAYITVPVDKNAACVSKYNDHHQPPVAISLFLCAGGKFINLPGIKKHDSGAGLATGKVDGARLIGVADYITFYGDAYARVSTDEWISQIICANGLGDAPNCPPSSQPAFPPTEAPQPAPAETASPAPGQTAPEQPPANTHPAATSRS